jgi:hypothetical protein
MTAGYLVEPGLAVARRAFVARYDLLIRSRAKVVDGRRRTSGRPGSRTDGRVERPRESDDVAVRAAVAPGSQMLRS